METITTSVDVYKFEELSKEAKQKALEKGREDENMDWPWYDGIEEEFKTDIENQGWERVEIWFTGFWSQGDGACFDAALSVYDWLNFHNRTEKYPLITKCVSDQELIWGATHKNNYGYHYSHERTRYFELEGECEDTLCSDGGIKEEELPALRDEWTALEKEIEEDRLDLCSDLYKKLEETYNSYFTDEAIIENFDANDTLFTIDGTRYHG